MKHTRALRWFAGVATIGATLLSACGGDDSNNDVDATPTFDGPTATIVQNVHTFTGTTTPPTLGPKTEAEATETAAVSTPGANSQQQTGASRTPGASGASGSTPASGSTTGGGSTAGSGTSRATNTPASSGDGGGGSSAAATPTSPPPPAPPEGGGSRVVSSMRIPSIGVNHPIEQLGLVPGRHQLDTPHNATTHVGWYSIYDAPGSGANILFSAHVNYNGANGPFAYLSSLPVGGEIIAVMADGVEYRYTVFSSARYSISEEYATASQPMIDMDTVVFAPQKPGNEEWVTLITCSCEPGRIIIPEGQTYGDCIDRDVVIAKRIL